MKMKLIQVKVAELLREDPWLSGHGYAPLCEDLGDVQSQLEQNLQRLKCGLLVQTPGFDVSSKASKVMVGNARITVRAVENVVDNRRRPDCGTAQDAAEAAAWALNLASVPGVGTLVVKSVDSSLPDQRTLAYDVRLEVQTTLAGPV